MKAIDTERRILIDLLAATDAVWSPLRVWSPPRPCNIHELRKRYGSGGIAWSSDQVSAAGRKASQRAIESLADRAIVIITRHAGRASLVRLSEHGDAIARRLTQEATGMSYATECLQRLARLAGKPGTGIDGYVPETLATGTVWGDGNEDVLGQFQFDILPALVRGWVVSETTVHGHAWYKLTDNGLGVVAGHIEPPAFTDLPEPIMNGMSLYFDSLDAARANIDAMAPLKAGELGFIPAAVSRPIIGAGGAT